MSNSTKLKAFSSFLLISLTVLFYLSFQGIIEIPRNLNIGGLNFNLYGLILGVALLTVLELFQRRMSENEKVLIKPLLPWIILAILFGGRLWHVITDFHLYQDNLIATLYIWNGGLSIFGGLMGLFIVIHLTAGKYKLSILDKLCAYIPLGQFIGRIGNFINHELFGPPTNLPWKMFVPEGYRPEQFKEFDFFHPAFLYEMIGTGILFLILRYLPLRKGEQEGVVFYIYLIGYGFIRFVTDFFRLDYDMFWILSVGQIVCVFMIVFGLFKLRFHLSR